MVIEHRPRRRAASIRRSAQALSAYRQAVLEDTPLLYWPMDETEGAIATDISGNDRHATIAGAPALGQAGLVPADPGGSMLFTSVANYVSRAHDAGMLLPYTLEFWFIAGSNNTGWAKKGLSVSDLTFSIFGRTSAADGVRYNSNTVLNTYAAGHLVLRMSTTNLTTWNNGVRVLNNHAITTINHTAALEIGRGLHIDVSATAPVTLNGRAAHVALYSGALSDARIVDHYNIGIGA